MLPLEHSEILLTCILIAIIGLENQVLVFFLSGSLRQVLLYFKISTIPTYRVILLHPKIQIFPTIHMADFLEYFNTVLFQQIARQLHCTAVKELMRDNWMSLVVSRRWWIPAKISRTLRTIRHLYAQFSL